MPRSIRRKCGFDPPCRLQQLQAPGFWKSFAHKRVHCDRPCARFREASPRTSAASPEIPRSPRKQAARVAQRPAGEGLKMRRTPARAPISDAARWPDQPLRTFCRLLRLRQFLYVVELRARVRQRSLTRDSRPRRLAWLIRVALSRGWQPLTNARRSDE